MICVASCLVVLPISASPEPAEPFLVGVVLEWDEAGNVDVVPEEFASSDEEPVLHGSIWTQKNADGTVTCWAIGAPTPEGSGEGEAEGSEEFAAMFSGDCERYTDVLSVTTGGCFIQSQFGWCELFDCRTGWQDCNADIEFTHWPGQPITFYQDCGSDAQVLVCDQDPNDGTLEVNLCNYF